MKKYLNYIIYFIIVFSTFFLDQLTKIIVENNINQNTNDAYKDFKLVSVIFDEETNELIFKFLYKDEMAETAKDELYNKSNLPQ